MVIDLVTTEYIALLMWLPSDITAVNMDRFMHYTVYGHLATFRQRG